MGTVVFPDAELKIFLSASPEERARRRYRQLEEAGQTVSYETILHQIKKRDKNDSSRDIAPLRAAEDAVVIDSSEMDFEQVVEAISELAKMAIAKRKKRG
jgi:cytidylate kinase